MGSLFCGVRSVGVKQFIVGISLVLKGVSPYNVRQIN